MVIAIDLGGTIIKMALVKKGKIISKTTFEANSKRGLLHSLPKIEQAIERLLSNHSILKKEIKGIGIGFPGLVDSSKMRVLSTNKKYEDAREFDFIAWGIEQFNAPVFLENDARLALLGEWQFGSGIGFDNIVMVTLGTGVGSAALVQGQLLRGKHFQAGCLGGHFIVNVNGLKCTCGNLGCVEAEASTWRLADLIKSDERYPGSMIAGKKLNFKSLFKFAGEGDELCLSVRNDCLEVWAAGVINLIHAYDPELVVLGGGIMNSAAVIIPFILQKVEKNAWTPWGNVQIIQSKIPGKSALLGAYYLVTTQLSGPVN